MNFLKDTFSIVGVHECKLMSARGHSGWLAGYSIFLSLSFSALSFSISSFLFLQSSISFCFSLVPIFATNQCSRTNTAVMNISGQKTTLLLHTRIFLCVCVRVCMCRTERDTERERLPRDEEYIYPDLCSICTIPTCTYECVC